MTITKGGMDLENIPESPCGMAASQHIGQQAPISDGKGLALTAPTLMRWCFA